MQRSRLRPANKWLNYLTNDLICLRPYCYLPDMQSDDKSIESFRSSLDANYDWPALFTFKFIVPQDQITQILESFSVEPVKAQQSSSGRFTSYTFEMEMNSSQHVVETYASVSAIPGLISL